MMDMSVAEIKKGAKKSQAMAFYSQKSLGCGGVPPKKPGKEIKERNVEDSETAGFLEICLFCLKKCILGGIT